MEYPKKQRILKLFGETAIIYDDRHERDEARSYLNSWKKFLIRRLNRDSYQVKVIDEQWGEIPAHHVSALAVSPVLYLKLIVEFEWHYEDGNDIDGTPFDENWLVKDEKT